MELGAREARDAGQSQVEGANVASDSEESHHWEMDVPELEGPNQEAIDGVRREQVISKKLHLLAEDFSVSRPQVEYLSTPCI